MAKSAGNLYPGEKGIVDRLAGKGALVQRLIDLGITEGTTVTLKKAAPFGGPLEIEVRGSRLGIRREQASNIILRTCKEEGGKAAAEQSKGSGLGIGGQPELRKNDSV